MLIGENRRKFEGINRVHTWDNMTDIWLRIYYDCRTEAVLMQPVINQEFNWGGGELSEILGLVITS